MCTNIVPCGGVQISEYYMLSPESHTTFSCLYGNFLPLFIICAYVQNSVINKKFDLKGSTYHRQASEKELAKSSPVLKDLDWIREGRKLAFGSKEEVESVRKRLEKDTLYLRRENLIDYSLLIGVHEMEEGEERSKRGEAMDVIYAESSTEIQYFGLVDILTPYVLPKKAETICTGTLMCRPGISCQPPKKYQTRFMSFVDEEILGCA